MKILSIGRSVCFWISIAAIVSQMLTSTALATEINLTTKSVNNQMSKSSESVAIARPCRTVNVHIDKIYINKGGDDGLDGDAEWHLDIFINGSKFEFDDGNVDTGETKTGGGPKDHTITLSNDTSMIFFETGGYEEDDNGDDQLPSSSWQHGIADRWGIGEHSKSVRNLEFHYTLFYTISCTSPLFSDLQLTMSNSENSVHGGDIFHYTFTITNNGPGDAQSVILTSNLPEGLTYMNANHDGCISVNNSVTCHLGKLIKTASVPIQIMVQADYLITGDILNRATVSLDSKNEDPNIADNSASEIVNGPLVSGPFPSRQCSEVNVHIDKIYINDAGNDGIFDETSEWRLDVAINNEGFEFNDDDVNSRETKPDASTYNFAPQDHRIALINDSAFAEFQVSGYENDTTSANDPLPSTTWGHGQSDNWGMGGQRAKYVRNQEFAYTIYYTISCMTPVEYKILLPVVSR